MIEQKYNPWKKFEDKWPSRRSLIRGAAGAVLGAGFLGPHAFLARADEREDHGDHAEGGGSPNPIPLGIAPFAPFGVFIHHLPPVPGKPLSNISELSSITDFDGFVGFTRIRGVGTTDTGQMLTFQVDNGFNQGTFIGTDGRRHHGTFAFV